MEGAVQGASHYLHEGGTLNCGGLYHLRRAQGVAWAVQQHHLTVALVVQKGRRDFTVAVVLRWGGMLQTNLTCGRTFGGRWPLVMS